MKFFHRHLTNQKYLAEFLGTFTLTLAVSLSLLLETSLPTPVIAALSVGIFVYTVGAISGAHFNPAVTIGMWSVKKISNHDAIAYIVVQVIGALVAMFISQSLTNAVVNPLVENTFTVGAAEAIGAFILVFGISAVVAEKVKPAASGLVIGGSLLLGILITSGLSNGVLNPAVAIGLNSISAMYLIAPIIGSLGGAWAYRYLNK